MQLQDCKDPVVEFNMPYEYGFKERVAKLKGRKLKIWKIKKQRKLSAVTAQVKTKNEITKYDTVAEEID